MGMTSVSGQRFRIDARYPDDPHHIRVTTVDRDSRLRITSLRGSRDRYAYILPLSPTVLYVPTFAGVGPPYRIS